MTQLFPTVLLAFVASAPSVRSAPPSPTRPAHQEAKEEASIYSACDELLQKYERAGWKGAVLVARDGKALLAKGYGRADPEKDRANSETTLFEIGSLSKQITATAILKLEQQEKLTTDDPIARHLPGVPAHSSKITILHLLTHTSGMPRTGPTARGEDLEEAVKAYLAEEPKNTPGAHFEYWNGGYALLAGIVERASGKSFTRYCEEELFAPAGMTDTGFTGDADLDPARAAIGESKDAEPRSALEHPYGSFGYQYRGMGGVVTTALDLLKWDRALARTAVLGEKARKKLFTPVQESYACGWYVGKSNTGKLRQSHEGDVRGFHVDMMRFPNEQACVAVLANTDLVPVWQIAENLECFLFGRTPLHPPPKSVEVADEELGGYGGRYQGKGGGALVVTEVDGGLEVGIEGQALLDEIVPREDGTKCAEVEALNEKAVQVIEAIAEGDLKFLDEVVLDERYDHWPETLVAIWPRQIEAHGAFKSVRALGATVEHGFVRALVAIEHERGSVRALLGFGTKGLQHLEWEGPRFVATLRLVPKGKNAFEEKRGEKPRRFEFTRKKKRVTGVTTGGLKLQRTD